MPATSCNMNILVKTMALEYSGDTQNIFGKEIII
jgi:hypothetical protein